MKKTLLHRVLALTLTLSLCLEAGHGWTIKPAATGPIPFFFQAEALSLAETSSRHNLLLTTSNPLARIRRWAPRPPIVLGIGTAAGLVLGLLWSGTLVFDRFTLEGIAAGFFIAMASRKTPFAKYVHLHTAFANAQAWELVLRPFITKGSECKALAAAIVQDFRDNLTTSWETWQPRLEALHTQVQKTGNLSNLRPHLFFPTGYEGLAPEEWDTETAKARSAEIISALHDHGLKLESFRDPKSRRSLDPAFVYRINQQRIDFDDWIKVDPGAKDIHIYVARIAHLIYMDERHFALLPEELRAKVGRNVIRIHKLTFSSFGDMGMRNYTISAILLMLKTPFRGRGFIDFGMGDGVLGQTAQRLGASCVIGLENKLPLVKIAEWQLSLNANAPTFFALHEDLTQTQNVLNAFARIFEKLPHIPREFVIGCNLGPGAGSPINNRNCIDLIPMLEKRFGIRITDFLAAGYVFIPSIAPELTEKLAEMGRDYAQDPEHLKNLHLGFEIIEHARVGTRQTYQPAWRGVRSAPPSASDPVAFATRRAA